MKNFCECCGQKLKEIFLEDKYPVYVLLKAIPGLNSGAVFILDKNDSIKGSVSHGCLKLAWDRGNCQQGWVAETFVFPGQLVKNTDWFQSIYNSHNRYTPHAKN